MSIITVIISGDRQVGKTVLLETISRAIKDKYPSIEVQYLNTYEKNIHINCKDRYHTIEFDAIKSPTIVLAELYNDMDGSDLVSQFKKVIGKQSCKE